MTKLYELLAAENTVTQATNKLYAETQAKFGKPEYFQGHFKTLKMLVDSPQNAALEEASTELRRLPTSVESTLDYFLGFWAKNEDLQFQKNFTNTKALADLKYKDHIIVSDVPVDELMGLENRLINLRRLMEAMPTLPASSVWLPDEISEHSGSWITQSPETTVKTNKVTTPIVLYEATDKHPAQIKEVTNEVTVGSFKLTKYSGAATSGQKAAVIEIIDTLIAETKAARMRANAVEVEERKIGLDLIKLILSPFD